MAAEENKEREEDEKREVGRSDIVLTGETGLSATQGYTTPPFFLYGNVCVCPYFETSLKSLPLSIMQALHSIIMLGHPKCLNNRICCLYDKRQEMLHVQC